MFAFPKIEEVTKDTTVVHFLLMFGYKLFSLYFPLFLVTRGLSLPEVGYTYLLIYLPLAIFSPVVGFLNHKISPATTSSIGILGYALYALGMIFIPATHPAGAALFYFWQIILGISAAMFFVSARSILIAAPLENYDRAFGWFYSAPFYADAIAPCIGAIFIWKFNFFGVFVFSFIVQVLTAIFCFSQLKKQEIKPLDRYFNLQKFQQSYASAFQKIKNKTILLPVLISFSALLLTGFYRAFFILFLKESLNWSQNLILILISAFSLLFLPISFLLIRQLGGFRSEKNIFQGGLITGLFSILFGILIPVLNFLAVLIIEIGKSAGSLIANAGRSGLITRVIAKGEDETLVSSPSQKLKDGPEEASVIDTIFAPLGVALGAFISGLLIGFLGYQFLFILAGVFLIAVIALTQLAPLEVCFYITKTVNFR